MQIKLGELSNKAFSSSSTFSLLGSVMHIPYRVYQEGVMFISKRTASLADGNFGKNMECKCIRKLNSKTMLGLGI